MIQAIGTFLTVLAISNIQLKSPMNWPSETSFLFTTIPLQPVSLSTLTVLLPIFPLTTHILLLAPDKGWTQALLSKGILLLQAKRSCSPSMHAWISSAVACGGEDCTKHPALTLILPHRITIFVLSLAQWIYNFLLHGRAYHTNSISWSDS